MTNKKIKKIIFLFLFLSGRVLFAGSFNITPSNLSQYSSNTGLVYSTSGSVTIDSTGGAGCTMVGFCANPSTATLTMGTFNIRYGQKWGTINVSISTTGASDSVDVYVMTASQVIVYSALNSRTSVSKDLSSYSQLANGAPFYLKLVFNGTPTSAVVTKITVNYSGNSILCYPSPYQPSFGNLNIIYEAETESLVTIEIYDNRGRFVKRIMASQHVASGTNRSQRNTTWDGRDESGRTVNTGVYTVVLRVVPFNSPDTSKYTAKFKLLVVR